MRYSACARVSWKSWRLSNEAAPGDLRLGALDELTATKYEYSIGLRHRIASTLLTFAFTENVQNLNNTPDIGFQLGIAYVPHVRKDGGSADAHANRCHSSSATF